MKVWRLEGAIWRRGGIDVCSSRARELHYRCSDMEVWSSGGALQACKCGSVEVWRLTSVPNDVEVRR